MANQAIALQARAPQTDILGGAIQQNAQMMNMMAQQTAAERQAAQAAQQMEIARAEEARAAALHGPAMDTARSEATAQGIKTALDFSNFVYTGLSNAADPAQATQIAQRIGQQPQFQEELFQGTLADAIATMPADPAEFAVWKEETLAQTLDGAKRLQRKLIEQTSGDEQRIISVPEYGRGAATEVPGSRIKAPPGITYVKDDVGNIYAMPKTMPSGGFDTPAPSSAPAPSGGGSPVARALQTNPGALKDGPFARSQPGYAGASGGFATFKTPEDGIRAQESLLRSAYVDKGFNTIDKIVNRYAPQGPENSAASVANYKKYIAQRTGIDINAPITAAQVPAVAAAMREFETGNKPSGAGGPTIRFGEPAVKGGQRKLTEQEQTASYNINRVLRAARVIAEASERSTEANAPGGLEAFVASTPLISGLVNFTRSEDRQIVAAAQRDLIDALLYLSTGAAYNKEQLEGQMESYLPQYSDAPGARESKRQRLAQLVKDAKSRAGRAWTPELDAAAEALYAKTFSGAGGGERKTPTGGAVDKNNPLLKGM